MNLRRHTGLMLVFMAVFTFLHGHAGALEVEFAVGFSVQEHEQYSEVVVNPEGAFAGRQAIHYLLVKKDRPDYQSVISALQEQRKDVPAQRIIGVPVEKCIPLSTTFLPPFLYFNSLERIAGIDDLDYLYDRRIKHNLQTRNIVEVGNGSSLDIERVVSVRPDLVIVNLIEGEWSVEPKLERAGIPVVVNADYLERTPLGRAEWAKFIGLFVGKSEEADRWFDSLRERYLELSAVAADAEETPSVFLNTPLSGRWVAPGGEGYMSHFLQDANAGYLWQGSGGAQSLILDIEEVFARALTADVWLHQYGAEGLDDLLRADRRFAMLKAVRDGRVANNDARRNAWGSNDFYESGPYHPDIILADLITILHGEILEDHELHYYRYLE